MGHKKIFAKGLSGDYYALQFDLFNVIQELARSSEGFPTPTSLACNS